MERAPELPLDPSSQLDPSSHLSLRTQVGRRMGDEEQKARPQLSSPGCWAHGPGGGAGQPPAGPLPWHRLR